MGYGGGGGGGGSGGGCGSGGGGGGAGGYGGAGGSGAGGGSGYRRVGDDRTANLKVDNITSRDGARGTEVDGIVEINTTAHFVPPVGNTAERGSRGRGIWGGGYGASSPYPNLSTLDYVTLATLGNGYDFGDLTTTGTCSGGVASSTRGLWWGGRRPGGGTSNIHTTIQYVTVSSTGNSFFFGDLSYRPTAGSGASNNTRGIFAGGYNAISPYSGPKGAGTGWTNIEYATIASLGNSSSFGDLTVGRHIQGSVSSPTRGVFAGGRSISAPGTPTSINVIDYIEIVTTGNAVDFGDLIAADADAFKGNAGNSSTRGIFCSGSGTGPGGQDNELTYITLASKGDAIDFGDSIDTTAGTGGSGTSNQTRGVYRPASGNTDTALETVIIATIGNSTGFGDLNTGRRVYGSISDSHGGLG